MLGYADLVVDNLNEGVIALDQDAVITFVNDALCRMVGYAREELVGRHATEFLDSYGAETFNGQFAERKTGKHALYELTFRRKDGETGTAFTSARPLFHEDGSLKGSLALMTDITGRKRLEEELKSSVERSRILFEFAPDGCFLSDLHGRFVDANRAAEEIVGYKKEELLGKSFLRSGVTLVPPSQLAKAAAVVGKTALGKPSGPDEFTLSRKDGTQVPVEVRTFPVHIDGQRLTLGIARDIADRKRTEDQLRESEERFRVSAENASIGVTLVGTDGRYVWVNQALCDILGYSREELLSTTVEDTSHPEDSHICDEFVRRALAGEVSSATFEKRHLHKQGHVVWTQVANALISDSEGNPLHFIAHVQDITELRRAENAQQRALMLLDNAEKLGKSGCWSQDLQTGREEWSQGEYCIHGLSRDVSPSYELHLQCVHPEDRERHARLYDEHVASDGTLFSQEYRIRRPDGTIRHIQAEYQIIRDEHGRPVSAEGTDKDITERKDVERRLAESEERFRGIADRSYDGILLVDQQGVLTYASPAVERISGFASDETVGRCFRDFFPEEEVPKVARHLVQLLQGRAVEGVELQALRKDGSRYWIESNAFPVVRGEKVVGAQVVFRDITDRKLAQQALQEANDELEERVAGRTAQLAAVNKELRQEVAEHRKAQEQLRLLSTAIEQSREGIAVTDMDGNLLFINESFAAAHGYAASELLGKHLGVFHTAEQMPSVEAANRALFETDEFCGEIGHVHRDGHVFPSLMHNSLLRDETGAPIGMIGTLRDMTERKRTERALKESEKRFRFAFDKGPLAFGLASPGGKITRVNDAFCRLVGYQREELLGRTFADITHPDDIEKSLTLARRLFAGEIPEFTLEKRYVTKDGETIWGRVIATAFHDDLGNVTTAMGIVEDITERKLAETLQEELTHAARLSVIGEMATGIAHELNQPLSAIATWVDVANRGFGKDDPEGREEGRHALGRASEQVHRAGEIIRRMRGFARKSQFRKSTVGIMEIIEEVRALVVPNLQDADVDVHVDVAPDLPLLPADRIQLQQVLVNLVLNAIDAMADNPPGTRRLTITAETTERELTVSVCDTGCGLPADDAGDVFDAFHTTKPHGMGLGLSICRTIIEPHKGRITATRNADRGTTFTFTIPLPED